MKEYIFDGEEFLIIENMLDIEELKNGSKWNLIYQSDLYDIQKKEYRKNLIIAIIFLLKEGNMIDLNHVLHILEIIGYKIEEIEEWHLIVVHEEIVDEQVYVFVKNTMKSNENTSDCDIIKI